jgi:hypothetical protein
MQRATKLLLFDISAFYLLGLGLLIKTYCFDEPWYFLFFMIFWAKVTTAFVGFGMAYWFYCIVRTFFGYPPQAPARSLGRAYLLIGMALLSLQVIHGQLKHFLPDRESHFYHYERGVRVIEPR